MANGDRVVKAVKAGEPATSPAEAVNTAPRLREEAGRSVTVPLSCPVVVGDTEITSLTPRRLKGRDLLKLKHRTPFYTREEEREALLFAIMCDVDVDTILALDADDFAEVIAAAEDFLPRYVTMDSAPTPGSGTSTPQT